MLSILRRQGESNRTNALALLLFAALCLAGCDGGIFGTGDSNSDDVSIATSSPGANNPPGSDEMPSSSLEESSGGEGDAGATGAPGSEIDDADEQSTEADEITPAGPAPEATTNEPERTIAFTNTLAGYPGVEPQLRFVNASSSTIRVSLDRTTGDDEIIEVAPYSVTPQAVLEIGRTIIDLTPDDAPAPAVRIVASLGLSSVSTVLIQSVDDASSVTALALETQSVTNDDSLAQLRLVAPAWDLSLSSGLWSLVPSGANPGTVDATLTAIVDAASDPSYTSITAGDYELRLDGQGTSLPTLTLNASSVTTLVLSRVMGNLQIIEVLDSDITGLLVTPD